MAIPQNGCGKSVKFHQIDHRLELRSGLLDHRLEDLLVVPGETPVFPMLEERGLNLGYLYGVCYPLSSSGSH